MVVRIYLPNSVPFLVRYGSCDKILENKTKPSGPDNILQLPVTNFLQIIRIFPPKFEVRIFWTLPDASAITLVSVRAFQASVNLKTCGFRDVLLYTA